MLYKPRKNGTVCKRSMVLLSKKHCTEIAAVVSKTRLYGTAWCSCVMKCFEKDQSRKEEYGYSIKKSAASVWL